MMVVNNPTIIRSAIFWGGGISPVDSDKGDFPSKTLPLWRPRSCWTFQMPGVFTEAFISTGSCCEVFWSSKLFLFFRKKNTSPVGGELDPATKNIKYSTCHGHDSFFLNAFSEPYSNVHKPFLPGTQMTFDFCLVKALVLGAWPYKIEVIWAIGALGNSATPSWGQNTSLIIHPGS